MKLSICKEVWGKHPDELAGVEWNEQMMADFIALRVVEHEEFEAMKTRQ